MITVFATYRNSDMTEGRGPMVLDKVFSNEDDAYSYINKQDGVMGRRPSNFGQKSWDQMGDWTVRSIVIYASINEADEAYQETLRHTALSKLTDAEKQALGLDRR